ncbi:hypothetical protein, partial [Bacillus altitudinis]|uniref:hypothetical protein n=1 Tax=Bacillus altitudinis TaxID=293387 RepID=UPI002F95E102
FLKLNYSSGNYPAYRMRDIIGRDVTDDYREIIVETLLLNGADITAEGENNFTVIDLAFSCKSTEIRSKILSRINPLP